MEEQISSAVETVIPLITEYGLQIVGAILTLIVGWIIAGWVQKATVNGLKRIPKMDETLVPFLATIVRYGVLIVVIVAVLNQFGVATTSIIALLGAAGLAIGLALQGTLSNIAAGVMLLMLRPFKVGEYIDAGSIGGTVVQIGLFTTEFLTADGIYLSAPNSSIWNQPIINYSRNPSRRLNLVIGISYDDDLEGASGILMALLTGDERVLKDPEPQVLVDALADSSVNLKMRCWTDTAEFWGLQFDLNKQAKLALEAAGYSIPFPQQDVHIISSKSGEASGKEAHH